MRARGRGARRPARRRHRRRDRRLRAPRRGRRRAPGSASSPSTCSAPRPSPAPPCRTSSATAGGSSPSSSTLGLKAVSDATAYCASKFGVVGFSRALAVETAGRVGVTMLIPGGMRTAFFDDRTEQYRPGPDAVLAPPSEIADAVVFALSRPPEVELRELVDGRAHGAVLAVIAGARRASSSCARSASATCSRPSRRCGRSPPTSPTTSGCSSRRAGSSRSSALLGGAVDAVLHAEGRDAPPGRAARRAPATPTWPSTSTAAGRRATRRCSPPRPDG